MDYLRGAPGIYSSRFAGSEATDHENVDKLLAELNEVPEGERTARFQCLLVFMKYDKDPTPLICQGTWEGSILHHPQGFGGFGYDPVFYVPSHDCASAELEPAVKNQLSHRGQALRKLVEAMKESK